MSDLEDFIFGGTAFSAEQIELAQSNYDARLDLLRAIKKARTDSGMTFESLTVELGWELTTVKEVFDGVRDITLTDLAQLANALDASITYKVSSKVSVHLRAFRSQLDEEQTWLTTKWSDINIEALDKHKVSV